ncbi:MAG: SLBB domain-containing protein [Candidatus Poribacteria bacterium]
MANKIRAVIFSLQYLIKRDFGKEACGKFLPPIVKFVIIFLFLLLIALNTSVTLSLGSTADVSEYIIGATDVLKISVWEQEQLSGTFPVRPDGKITIPLLGDIQAAGLTPTDLSNEISQKLGKYLKSGAQVSVAVIEFNSQKISILGQVSQPGKYNFAIIPSIMEVLTEAGGPLPTADLTSVKVFPKEQSRRVITVDLDAVFKGEDISPLPQLHPGDAIYIPPKVVETPESPSPKPMTSADTSKDVNESTSENVKSTAVIVDVLGQVPNPGRFEFEYRPTIVEVLNKAGGVADSFLLGRVRVVRGNAMSGGMIVVDVAKFLENGDYSLLPELQSGDIIYVPEADPMEKMKLSEIFISGRVVNPGNYAISSPIGLLEALGMAGGLQPDADAKKIKITRETTETFESQVVDISSLLQQEEPVTSTVIVQVGDAIFVPAKDSSLSSAADIMRSLAGFLRDAILVYSAYRIITGSTETSRIWY